MSRKVNCCAVYHTLGSRHITICGSLLWFYVSLEVEAVTLCPLIVCATVLEN